MPEKIQKGELFTTPRYLAVYAKFGHTISEMNACPDLTVEEIDYFAGLRPSLGEEAEILEKMDQLKKIHYPQVDQPAYMLPEEKRIDAEATYNYLDSNYGGSIVRFESEYDDRDRDKLEDRGVEIIEMLS